MAPRTLRSLRSWQDALVHAQSLDVITGLCRGIGESLGYDAFVYALRVPTSFAGAQVVQVKGYPEAWLQRYWERGYFADDPVIAHCGRSVLPLAWTRLGPVAPASRRVMQEATEFGLRRGVTAPVHGPHGELGILSFAGRAAPGRRRDEDRSLAFAHHLAGHVHEAVRRVVGLAAVDVRPALSPRERDCLRWASDGKTSWEIAQVLGVAERTVNFHLDNAAEKLGAVSRQHAIAKAIALGMLSPYPF